MGKIIKWTDKETKFLKDNFTLGYKELSEKLGRPIKGVKKKCRDLNIRVKLKSKGWTKEDYDILINNYGKIPISELSKILDRPEHSIINKASSIKISRQTPRHGYKIFSRRLLHMHNRCYNKDYIGYDNYGGRGIYIANEWNYYIIDRLQAIRNFAEWSIANGYKKGLQIDRIDNNGPYASWNCQWTTYTKQCKNKQKKATSKYTGVHLFRGRWKVTVDLKNKVKVFVGSFTDEIQAAIAYNQYIIDNNLNKELNVIENESFGSRQQDVQLESSKCSSAPK